MTNFDDFVEQVRDANPIEAVIEEGGITLRGHGRIREGTKHDSLKVRTDFQRAWWYSQKWNGDVFAWVMREKGCEFMEALEILARRSHLEMPRFKAVNEGEVRKTRAAAEVFTLAAGVFQRWLLGDEARGVRGDAKALEYAQGRGWTDETLQLSMLGFSGRREDWQLKDMSGELDLFGIDKRSLEAVAVLGLQDEISKWADERGVRGEEDFNAEWIEKGRIHGLMDTPGLIYAHRYRGGVNYLSRRQLPGHDRIGNKEWKSYNPPRLLAGPKQVYFNHMHRTDRPLIVVEGQGDAITWGQWGYGAVALCGLMGETKNLAPEDAERTRKLAGYLMKHSQVYLALDEDEAGQESMRAAGRLLGPKVQIVRMDMTWTREDAEAAHKNETVVEMIDGES